MKLKLYACVFLSVALMVPGSATARTLDVVPGTSTDALRTAVASAAAGDTLFLAAGTYQGPVTIDRTMTVTSYGDAVIDGGGAGCVLNVTAPDVTLRRLTIRNSGTSLTREDAGVSGGAARLRVEDCRIENVLFGIYLRQAPDAIVQGNTIVGYRALDVPRRGDLVRAWYSRGLHMVSNTLESGRDVIVWFSDSSLVANNTVSGARYGVHFMYDNDCTATGNILTNNAVGVYMMYSRRLSVTNNTIAYNRGTTGLGIGLKDVDDSTVAGNLVVDNCSGIYVDNSPRDIDSHLRYERNAVAFNDDGMRFIGVVERTEVTNNSFIDNYEDVLAEGGRELSGVDWHKNFWSGLTGFDLDGDGVSDVPYRAERLFEDLIAHHPRLRLFIYSPAIEALDLAARAFPVVRPEAKFTDETPRVQAMLPAEAPGLLRPPAWSLACVSAALAALGISTALLGNVDAGPLGRFRVRRPRTSAALMREEGER
ncbi:MAG TPA: nitrous oxide reductase family maturation protein NosD [Candidatus Krumholzibacteria bacterium]|nr:nitrous oxide reductase family maturation protein NosD [Candidatus Krumholzibacteria bacterium]